MPILREGELDIISHSVEMTTRLGMRLGALLDAGDLVCLTGDMGTGKTVFSSGIGRGWGTVSPVTSPTFNLVHQHRRKKDNQLLYHLDCYRLHDVDEVDSIGLDDILNDRAAVVVEWAERIETVLPEERLWVELRVIEESRRSFIFEATGERYQKLLEEFRRNSFGF